MTHQPTTPTTEPTPWQSTMPGVAVGDVYVLTEHMQEGNTVLYITTSLDDAQNFHANHPIRTQVHPWERITRSGVTVWVTRPRSGGYGAVLFISKMPVHALPGATADTITEAFSDLRDNLLDADAQKAAVEQGLNDTPASTYDPLRAEVAPGVTSFPDPHNPDRHVTTDTEADEAHAEASQDSTEASTGEDRYTRLHNAILALIPTSDPELIDAGYEVLASDILAIIDRLDTAGTPHDSATVLTQPGLASTADAEAFRNGFYVAVPTISDSALIALMNDNPHLLALAREWGWNETQVRDDFAAALETHGHTLH